MKLLLDTCTFLWLIKGQEWVSQDAYNAFVNPDNEVYFSAVSAWEISVKYQLGKLRLPVPPEKFIPKERQRHYISPLDLTEKDTLHLCKLPTPHKDPFDRMLICQAIEKSLILMTPDPLILQYPVRTLW